MRLIHSGQFFEGLHHDSTLNNDEQENIKICTPSTLLEVARKEHEIYKMVVRYIY